MDNAQEFDSWYCRFKSCLGYKIKVEGKYVLICKICDREFKNNRGFSSHLQFHNITSKEYLIQYCYDDIPKCMCGNPVQIFRNTIFRKTCGNKECFSNAQKSRTHTDITKEKIRRERFKYLSKKTGKTAWERRSSGKMSYLEQWFFDEVVTKHNLLEKYDVINEYPIYPYLIDFAFLNIKLAVELDGACHFKHGDDRVDHDIKKDNFLIANGWDIFRISYKENNNDIIDKFMISLQNASEHKIDKILGSVLHKGSLKQIKPKRTREEYFEDWRRDIFISNQKYIPMILNSGIDFSKLGWVNEVTKILNIQHQKVGLWMKKYMPEFYETSCYKRKQRI